MTITDPLFDESDLAVADYHCRHGVFTGNPYGADYMCGWCESGEEPPTQREVDESTLRVAAKAYDGLVAALSNIGWECNVSRWGLILLAESTVHDISPRAQAAWDRLQHCAECGQPPGHGGQPGGYSGCPTCGYCA